jgi:hypothetical protein
MLSQKRPYQIIAKNSMQAKWIFISSSIVVILIAFIFWNYSTVEDHETSTLGFDAASKQSRQQDAHFSSSANSSFSHSNHSIPSPSQVADPSPIDSPSQNRGHSSKFVNSSVAALGTSAQAPQSSKAAPGMVSGGSQLVGNSSSSSNQEPAIREIVQNVPEGAKVPTVFYDDTEKPLPQQKALDRIAEEFEKNVSEVPPGLTREEVWETARSIADERYITLFGYQAFNQYHLKAAKEALKEKRARAAVGQINP